MANGVGGYLPSARCMRPDGGRIILKGSEPFKF